jgi:predicted RNA binding protein YcfA (HicA-like mRNA interferase family)
MPPKIRDLKAALRRAGFSERPGKGSHTVWNHPSLRRRLTVSGGDGDDAKPYQQRDVRDALADVQQADDSASRSN